MEQVDSSNHKFIKIEAEVRTGITISKTIKTGIGQIVATEDSIGKIGVGLDMNKITGEEISEETWGALKDRIVDKSIETITETKVMKEARTGLEKGFFKKL